jgi:hypothetical protein
MDPLAHIYKIPAESWDQPFSDAERAAAVAALEDGKILLLPDLKFALSAEETRFLDPRIVGSRKNVSYDRASGKLGGSVCEGEEAAELARVMNRFATQAREFIMNLLAPYQAKIVQGRSSLRPVQAAGRATSWRKDDTRLHVDSFPATPVSGKRILRLFSNVNQKNEPRRWRVGEPFEGVAKRFAPSVPAPFPGSRAFMQLFHITRGHRSLYDHYMLRLHDSMKESDDYQKTAPQFEFPFPAGSTWIVFTDQVPHAVISGQHQFEQTFYLPIEGMADPAKSPYRVLERITGKSMA